MASVSSDTEGYLRLRYVLQETAVKLIAPSARVKRCHVELIPGRAYVKVYVPQAGRAPSFGNLVTCGSIWHCPVCAAKISEARRVELSAAIAVPDYNHVLVTYTLRHTLGDPLKRLLSALLDALRAFRSGRAWQAFRRRVGWLGSVRSLEVTYSAANGWHPHLHELVFFSDAVDVGAFLDFLRLRWIKVLQASGATASYLAGLDARFAKRDIADYIAKFGADPRWTSAHELSKHVVKRGRAASVTPLDLLSKARQGDAGASALWQEYALGMSGRHHLQWSRGLRSRLGIGEQVSDAELAQDDSAAPFFTIRSDRWQRIVKAGARGDLLESLRSN